MFTLWSYFLCGYLWVHYYLHYVLVRPSSLSFYLGSTASYLGEGAARLENPHPYHSKCLNPWYGPTEELVGLYLSRYWASEW
jgi:hypothetical protein